MTHPTIHFLADMPVAPIPTSLRHKRGVIINQAFIDPDKTGWLRTDLLGTWLDENVKPDFSGILMGDWEYGFVECVDDLTSPNRPRAVRQRALFLHQLSLERPAAQRCLYDSRPVPFSMPDQRFSTADDLWRCSRGLGSIWQTQSYDTPQIGFAYFDGDDHIPDGSIDNWLRAIMQSKPMGHPCVPTLKFRGAGAHLYELVPLTQWKRSLKLLRAEGCVQACVWNADVWCTKVANGESQPEGDTPEARDKNLKIIQANFGKGHDLVAEQAPYLDVLAEVWQ